MATEHPAPYSPEVLAAFTGLFGRYLDGPVLVHDPFAGTGERLGGLCDTLGLPFSGTELAEAFIVDPRVRQGDSTLKGTYPRRKHWVVATSPVYPNGIADDFHAQERCSACKGTGKQPGTPEFGVLACEKCDGSGVRQHHRRTYRSWNAKLLGHDEPLHANNMGRWGYRGTKLDSPKRAMYWKLARDCARHWTRAETVFVNVSDFTVKDRVEPVVEGWVHVLAGAGLDVVEQHQVSTKRWRDGANADRRVEAESILVAVPR